MGRDIRFGHDDALRFAAWSGDRNPLHVDPAAARRSVFGQPVIHGMLTTLRAIGSAGLDPTLPVRTLHVEFRHAVHPDQPCVLEPLTVDTGIGFTVRTGGDVALAVHVNGGPASVAPAAPSSWLDLARRHLREAPPLRRDPAAPDLETLQRGHEVIAAHITGEVPSEYVAGSPLHPVQARVLALCSYVIGMEMPGLRSLFTRLHLDFAPGTDDAPELLFRARTVRCDPNFRLLDVSLEVATPEGRHVASGELRAYVRFTPVEADTASVLGLLSPGARGLAGRVALVTGGSRGLGAEITTALALAGCQVHASYRGDEAAANDLARLLADAPGSVTFVRGDAGDPRWSEATLAAILARHQRLDLLVLNACAPPEYLRVAGGSPGAFGAYITANLPLAQVPLSACLPALAASRGTVVGISSSFVSDPPAGFGHYVALKEVVESTIRTAVRETPGIRAVLARPPRLQTAWNDTPTGVLGTIAARDAAVQIVNTVADARDGVSLLTDFPVLRASTRTDSPTEAAAAPPEFFLSLSSSFTADPLVPGLEFWFRELGVRGEVEVAPYGQVLQTLLSPTGGLSGRPGAHVVMLRLRDWLRELRPEDAASDEFLRTYLDATAQDFERAMRAHRGQAAAETVLVFCPSAPERPDAAEPLLEETERALVGRLAGLPGLTVVRARDLHALYEVTENTVGDPVREHLAHIPYQAGYLHTLATIAMRHVHRKLAPPRKLVAVDCDNTLWSGVVGEVGAEGLRFDEGHGALHEALTRLADAGVLVALCSKNEEADVWRVFETRPDLGLDRARIVTAAINWQPKSANLRAMAERLNLGLDSFIFIDDNPVECAEVRSACPQVLTLEWPQDAASARRLLQHTWELDARDTTAEDRRRTELYKEEFRRQELQTQALTFRDFIASLDLVVDIAPLAPEDLKRAAQLTLRTNQFNFTTRRRDEADMQALAGAGTHDIRTVKVRDRFGDYGLVGLLIAEPDGEALFADTFLLSCRVLGRGVEHRMVAELGRIAAERGASAVRLRVDPTKRNTPARTFLQSLAPSDASRHDGGAIEAVLQVDIARALTFEPPDQAPAPVAETERAAPAAAGDTARIRTREEQIRRTAFDLATPAALAAAIDGTPVPGRAEAAGPVDTSFVFDAFARALGRPADEIRRVDSLEALGCDSFKIVEITVSLLERFPQLPGTLLFEHRNVSDIARHIERLSGPGDVTSAEPSPAPAGRAAHGSGDIAVVGMHLRCAGAGSPDELWTLLSGGGIAVAPVPGDRPYFFGRLDDTRPHFAGLIDGIDRFDAELFGITPREAEVMDPQLRLFLEVAWSALEDAGCLGEELDPQTGVFAGVMYGDYATHANPAAKEAHNPFKCWEGFSLANRLSQVFGFRGPSLSVDTACSSSGTAVHLACRALNAGDCRVAIAGGVNLILDPDRFVQLGRLGILSESGRCLAFGAEADGTVLGEGAGVVVLRPLEEAIGRGDRIYGVIKATGVSTGSGTVGFTAPNPVAQAEAIRRAVRGAGIDPRTIGYVETHGTGTALGDPIEVRGLMLAYGDRSLWDPAVETTPACAIGSIKPNIGHLEAGAGVMGLIKLLLQVQRGWLLPSVTSPEPNPQIPFSDTPFSVQRSLGAWNTAPARVNGVAATVPRRGALNSFGVGGANAHVIVEEPPVPPARERLLDRPMHLLTIAARSGDALRQRARTLADLLASDTGVALEDLCFSMNTGQRHLAQRSALSARTREDMMRSLMELAEGGDPAQGVQGSVPRSGAAPDVAFLFTGQGAQAAGMGRELYDTQPVFRQALDRCFELFAPLLQGGDLKASMFADDGSPAAALLNQTGFTQPALFSLGYALSELWRSWGITPSVVLGHSIGEITAMCVAGGLSLEDAVTMVAARGTLMQALPSGGAMTSLMTTEARAAEAISGLEGRVSIAAVNAPAQVVISGEAAAVQSVAERLSAAGVKTRSLVVSHAFHSPLMQPMLEAYARVLRRVRFMPPRVAFVSSVLGRVAGDELREPGYWLRNVTDPVRFTDGIAAVGAMGITAFVELGPQPVLTGLGRQCLAETEGAERLWLPSVRKDSAWPPLLTSLAQLYAAGAGVDWRGFDAPYERRRVPLPRYPFGGRRHWIAALASAPAQTTAARVAGVADRDAPRIYEITWQDQPAGRTPLPKTGGHWVLVADDAPTSAAVARELQSDGATCTVVVTGSGIDPAQALAVSDALRGVVYLPASDPATIEPASIAARAEQAFDVLRAVARLDGPARPALWIVTRGAVQVSPGDRTAIDPVHGSLWGAGRTFALEHPDRWGGLIDIPAGLDPASAAAAIGREWRSDGQDDQVAIRPTGRFVPRLARRDVPAVVPVAASSRGTYLVTGGLGVLGLRAAQWLVARGAKHLVLTGRRGAESPGAAEAVRDLEAAGATVAVVAADASTREGIERALGAVAAAAPLSGIIHTAGIDDTTPIAGTKPGDAARVMAAKASGAWLLHDRTRDLPLETFVCFSSIASVLGSAGRGAYGAANAFLDALALERRRIGLPALSVNWGPWGGGGMATPGALEQYERFGNRALEADAAVASMEALLSTDMAQAMVADIDWETFRLAYEAARPRPLVVGLSASIGRSGARNAEPPVSKAPWIDRLTALPPDLRLAELTSLLRTEVAQTLGLDGAADVAPDQVFRDIGMDSLMTADFAQRLQKRLGIRSTAMVFEHPTVTRLAAHLVETLALPAAARAEVAEAVVGAPADALAFYFASERPPAPSAAPREPGPGNGDGGRTEGYAPESEADVFAFQRVAWPGRREDLIAARWRWMFVESARRLHLAPRVWLHRHGGRIVGHNGAIPVRLKIGDEEQTTAWLVDTMVLAEYRREAVGARLMVEAHEDLPFALSLGQTEQMRAIQLRLGWHQVAPLETAQLLIRPERVLKGKLPGPAALAAGLALRAGGAFREAVRGRAAASVRELPRFDESHDRMWHTFSSDMFCAVRRDASYLNWKYVDQPGQAFLRLEITSSAGARGLVVLMFREPDGAYQYRRAFIVDVVAPLANEAFMAELLMAATRAAADRGADALLCLHIGRRLTEALQRAGFRMRGPSRYLLVRPGGLDTPLRDRVLDSDAWFVTQGDSDIDRP